MAVKIDRWDPQFCRNELCMLYDYLSEMCELPYDEKHWILTKKEFIELDVYSDEGYYDPDDEDDIERIANFASMLERIRELQDDDVLEINFENAV